MLQLKTNFWTYTFIKCMCFSQHQTSGRNDGIGLLLMITCPKRLGSTVKPIDLRSQMKAVTVNPPKHSKTFATKITMSSKCIKGEKKVISSTDLTGLLRFLLFCLLFLLFLNFSHKGLNFFGLQDLQWLVSSDNGKFNIFPS